MNINKLPRSKEHYSLYGADKPYPLTEGMDLKTEKVQKININRIEYIYVYLINLQRKADRVECFLK